MDTAVTERQKRSKQALLSRAYAPHRDSCWWCAILCVLVCGCDLLKTTPARQTAEPPAGSRAAQSSDQVAESPPPRPAAAATPTGPTPQPLAVRTATVDPPPAPALNPTPPARAQFLLAPSASAKVQTSHTVSNSVANPPTPQTTVTYLPREAPAAIVIKGPPRQAKPPGRLSAFPLSIRMGLGAVLVALVFHAKRRFRMASNHKARKDELFLPSEFKLKDSAIQPEAPLGMLAPEKRVSRSKMELLVSMLASATSAIRFLVSKLPVQRVGASCRALWQRISPAPLPAISDQCPSKPLSPEAADSNRAEISATVASQSTPDENGVQGKPDESYPSPRSANPGVPGGAPPIQAPTFVPKTAAKIADEAFFT